MLMKPNKLLVKSLVFLSLILYFTNGFSVLVSYACHGRWNDSVAAENGCTLGKAKRAKSFCRFSFTCHGKKYYLSCGPGRAPYYLSDMPTEAPSCY